MDDWPSHGVGGWIGGEGVSLGEEGKRKQKEVKCKEKRNGNDNNKS